MVKALFLPDLFSLEKKSSGTAKGFVLGWNLCKIKAESLSSPLADSHLKRTSRNDLLQWNSSREPRADLPDCFTTDNLLLQMLPCSHILLLLLLPSLVARQLQKDQRACWRKPPCGTLHGFGFYFLENAPGQSGLGFGGKASLWNLALHEHWSWGKWCIAIITKINAFTDSELTSDLFCGSAAPHQFHRSTDQGAQAQKSPACTAGDFPITDTPHSWGSLL